MSVSKNKVTNSLLKSEKQSLFRFLGLYATLAFIIIVVWATYYYQSQEKLMLADKRALLTKYAYIQTKRLKVLHHFFDERTEYPRDSRFKSAIYDLEFIQIFSLLEEKEVHFDEGIYIVNRQIHFVKNLDDFYLGTKYLVIEIEDTGIWRNDIWRSIIFYGVISFFFFMFFGFYLAKMFLKPMRDSIVLLDRFIKDTTHELNTPLAAILANIEMMDKELMIEKNVIKLNRINIAATTVSMLYKDLTYLTLEQEQKNNDEEIDLKALIYNRTEYFNILAESKKLTFHLHLEEATLYIDKRKITRVIDNLISNAIKYNKRHGRIEITLQKNCLIVHDTGIGVKVQNIPFMFDRYLRFNESEGGFGVGLSIVKGILKEYHISIEVKSIEMKGTTMVLTW